MKHGGEYNIYEAVIAIDYRRERFGEELSLTGWPGRVNYPVSGNPQLAVGILQQAGYDELCLN